MEDQESDIFLLHCYKACRKLSVSRTTPYAYIVDGLSPQKKFKMGVCRPPKEIILMHPSVVCLQKNQLRTRQGVSETGKNAF